MSYICYDIRNRRIEMTKRKRAAVSPAETEVLRLVWESEKATVQQVYDALPANRKVTYLTVATLLRRLEEKGYLKHRVRGKAFVYIPAVKKEDVINRTISDLVQRLFGGNPVPLMQHLALHSEISDEDIERLRDLAKKK
jgi:BlaI family penicillinase repressor